MNRLHKLLLILGIVLITDQSLAADTPPPQTLFTNVNIFNGTDDKLYENHNVLVENNLIRVISASAINTNANATVMDGQGRTLLPGLIDSHMHFNMNAINLNAIAGMRWDEIGARAAAQAADWLADGFTTVRAAVRRNFARGASQIKIMVGGGISSEKGPLFAPQFTDAEITAAVEEAATRDTYVAVHVYQDAHVRRALELGVKSIEHGQFLSEDTARLLKDKGAFIAPFTAGITAEAFQHPAYSVPGTPQFIKGKEFQRDSKNFIEIM